MVHILLIEDDRAIASITRFFLEKQKGYQVTYAKNGNEALSYARGSFDIILMDILLPDVNGVDLCKTLRLWHKCPIIFCSCLDDSDTIIRALEMGGDDFIPKPFDNKVLLARIQANLRRVRLDEEENQKKSAGNRIFSMDPASQSVKIRGKAIKLSSTEFRILSYLVDHAGSYVTGEEIYQSLWGRDSGGDARTVQVHIHNLRKKIEVDPANPVYLKNIWGKGYSLDVSS